MQTALRKKDPNAEIGGLDEPEIPDTLIGIWVIFWEIFDDGTISYCEMAEYCRLTGTRLSGTATEMIRAMSKAGASKIAEIEQAERGHNGGGYSKAGN